MKKYFIDTNVLIYAQGTEHKYKSPCQIILRLIAADEIYGVINTEVLQEILYYYCRGGKRQPGFQLVEYVLSIMHEILPIEKADILLAGGILRKHSGVGVRDAIHAASAFRNNFKYILSVDKHFDAINSLQRIDPLEI